MSGGYYKQLTDKVDYRILTLLPPAVAVLLLLPVLINGLEYGVDFKGGMWMDVLTPTELDAGKLKALEADLQAAGLKDVKATVGFDIDTHQNKLVVQTTTVVQDKKPVTRAISKYAGTLTEYDTAVIPYSGKLPLDFTQNLEKRLKQGIDVNQTDGKLILSGLDFNKDDLQSAVSYYLREEVKVDLAKKNFNIRSVGPTLGKSFREQGFKAIVLALIFMGFVVFVAFRDIIPTVAVIQAAINDVLFAVGGMYLLGIPMEPASLAALLMLIGYSVDTDVLLTARVLKNRSEDFYVLVDDAMKTGITMTLTTITVMTIVYVVSTTLTQITTLANISAVLWMGLFADIFTTWITNVGVLKWYLDNPRHKDMWKVWRWRR